MDCGYYGITETECGDNECCWQESDVSGVPYCFQKIGESELRDKARVTIHRSWVTVPYMELLVIITVAMYYNYMITTAVASNAALQLLVPLLQLCSSYNFTCKIKWC